MSQRITLTFANPIYLSNYCILYLNCSSISGILPQFLLYLTLFFRFCCSSHIKDEKTAHPRYRLLRRVIRTSFPIQVFLLLLLSILSIFPNIEEEFSCSLANNMAWSFEPILRYPNGRPPT